MVEVLLIGATVTMPEDVGFELRGTVVRAKVDRVEMHQSRHYEPGERAWGLTLRSSVSTPCHPVTLSPERSESPPHYGRAPGQAGPEARQDRELAGEDATGGDCLVERDRDAAR